MAKSKKKTNTNKSGSSFFWIVVIIAVGLLTLIFFLGNKSSEPTKDKAFDFDYSSQPFEGDEKAPVKIVEFGDYKCPICKDFNESVYPVIQKELVDTGKAQFYFMNFPFINTDSTRSAEFAETVYKELGNDVFWEFHHLLYSKQPQDQKYEKMDYFTEDFLKKALAEVASDNDVKKVVDAFHNKDYVEALKKDQSYVEKLGIDSTPTLFINGKKFTGSNFGEFIQQVKDAAK
ncbi:DsbA family protein [Heyndrickxia sp. NPDC080065]|uniref:DsbA family protein n=1 Tax=Heyndrickxia sp. NPDC080065 TaxID=3390568 RepID=UPI003D061A56